MLICVVGDCTLDVTVTPQGPMRAGGDVPSRITIGPGGQAANVAVRLARRGLRVRLVAPIADDAGGYLLQSHLAAESVAVAMLPAPRTSMVVALVGSDGERGMASDRVRLEGDIAGALEGADWVHVSGYVLRDRGEAERIITATRVADGARVSVAGGSFGGPTDAAVARDAVAALGVSLLLMDRGEARLLAGNAAQTAEDAAILLGAPDRLAIVTDGQLGSAGAGGPLGRPLTIPAPAVSSDPVDGTGAGDAYAAAVIAGLAPLWPPSEEAIRNALQDASRAGARATEVIGAQGLLRGELERSSWTAATERL